MEMLAQRNVREGDQVDRADEKFDRIDERLVDVDRRISETGKATDLRLKEVDRRITEGNEDSSRRFKEVKGEIKETREAVKELGQQMHSLQITFMRGHFALVASVVGAIFALLIKGG
jgi:DNA repair exonuclease SbcCD ATPase subunit